MIEFAIIAVFNLIFNVMALYFLTKLNVIDIQLNESDLPVEVIIKKITNLFRNMKMIAGSIILINILTLLFEAGELFTTNEERGIDLFRLN